MGTHSKSWSGLDLLVFGSSPTVPMKIEQTIAISSPASEVRLESYEHYEDALDFCKSKKSVGLIFVLENCGRYPAQEVLKQLAEPLEARGWPAFGVLLHEGPPSIPGLSAMKNCKEFLDYLPASRFLEPSEAARAMNEIWESFSSAFEAKVCPRQLEETLTALVSTQVNSESIRFMDRASRVLCANLDVSWLDMAAIRWAPLIAAVREMYPSAIAPHSGLVAIAERAIPEKSYPGIEATIRSGIQLPKRVIGLVQQLNDLRKSGELDSQLQSLGARAVPGSPGLLQYLVSVRQRIVDIAAEEMMYAKREATG